MRSLLPLLVLFQISIVQAYDIKLLEYRDREHAVNSSEALINISTSKNSETRTKEARKRSLGPELRSLFLNYIPKIKDLFSELSPRNNQETKDSEIENILHKLSSMNSGIDIYGAANESELHILCELADAPVDELEYNGKKLSIACSKNNETYLNESLFVSLNLIDQASVLFFERLSTLKDQTDNSMNLNSLKVVNGLELYSTLFNEQKMNTYRLLTQVEAGSLTDFYQSVEALQYRNQNITIESLQYSAHPYGGGRVHRNTKISIEAIISLGSKVAHSITVKGKSKIINSELVGQNGIVDDDVEIRDSFITGNLFVKRNSSILNSNFYGELVLGEDVLVEDTKGSGKLTVGNKVQITKSEINTLDLLIKEEVNIANSIITLKKESRFILGNQNINSNIISDYWHEHLFSPDSVPAGYEFQTSYSDNYTNICTKNDEGRVYNLSYLEDENGNFAKADVTLKIIRTEKDGFFKKKYFCTSIINFHTFYKKFKELGENAILLLQNNGELAKASPRLLRKEKKLIGSLPNNNVQFYWRQISGQYVSLGPYVYGYDLYLNIP